MKNSRSSFTLRRRRKGSIAAETSLALFLLVLVFGFPLINLCSIVTAYASVLFFAYNSALAASVQPDYKNSLSVLERKTAEFNKSGLTQMLKLQPSGGYKGNGVDLYIEAINYLDSNKNKVYGPNVALPPPLDINNNLYEVAADATYSVDPFVNLKAVPFLEKVPGLGAPAVLHATIKRCAEFPQGLVRGPAGESSTPGQSAIAGVTRFTNPISNPSEFGEPWHRPKIYEEIDASGQKIIDHVVVEVRADNPRWTPTGLTVNPGQTVWLDFRADGVWERRDADGAPRSYPKPRNRGGVYVYDDYQEGNLIGAVDPKSDRIDASAQYSTERDTDGSIIAPINSYYMYATGETFNVGKRLYQYRPTKTGKLSLGYNNISEIGDINLGSIQLSKTATERQSDIDKAFSAKKGAMIVRVIVTQ